jgi:hypothetical protein
MVSIRRTSRTCMLCCVELGMKVVPLEVPDVIDCHLFLELKAFLEQFIHYSTCEDILELVEHTCSSACSQSLANGPSTESVHSQDSV